MFRELVAQLEAANPGFAQGYANLVLTQYRPTELGAYVEQVWSAPRANVKAWELPALQPLGIPQLPAPVGGALAVSREMARDAIPGVNGPQEQRAAVYWPHLIYAYMVENTGAIEIFRRIVADWISDERLPYARLETQYWIRATEELFFTTPSPFFHSLTSTLRPDSAAIRENAYQRLLGLDLSFRRDGQSAPPRPRSSNNEFTRTLERLLHEVWRGYINRMTSTSVNLTDEQAMLELVRELREMLIARRTYGTLLREEFDAVNTASWFFLTVEHDNFIIQNLNAQAPSAAQRLRKVAALVGMQPSRVADSYFHLADPLSNLLIDIETGAIEAAGVDNLYNPAVNALMSQDLQVIITHWSEATGRSVKDIGTLRPAQVGVPAAVTPPAAVLNRIAGVTVTA